MAGTTDPTMGLIYDIEDLVYRGCSQEEIDDIMNQAEGYRFQMRCSGCDYILGERTREGLMKLQGWLRSFVTTCSSGQTSITNTNTATATASAEVTFSSVMSQVWSLPEGKLDDEGKRELAELLREFEDERGKDEGKLAKAGRKVADWMFDNAIGAIPTVMPYIVQAIQGVA